MKSNVISIYIKIACLIVFITGVGFLMIVGKQIFLPLAFSFIIALLLLPVSNFMENKFKFSRPIAGIISVTILLILISILFYELGSQLAGLSDEWPLLKKQLTESFINVQHWFSNTFHINQKKETEFLNQTTQKVINSGGSILEKTVLSVSTIFLILIFIIIYTLFILIYRRRWMRFILASFPEKHKELIYDISENIKNITRKYVTGLFFEMVILVIAGGLVFWLLGIKYIFLFALILGVFNLIPYIGIYTALVISSAITFATTDASHALYVAISIIIIHIIDSNFLMPKIVGSQIKINPMMVVLGVVAGELLWGIPGMFLSIPYIAMAKVIFDRIPNLQPLGILLGDEEKKPTKLQLKNSE